MILFTCVQVRAQVINVVDPGREYNPVRVCHYFIDRSGNTDVSELRDSMFAPVKQDMLTFGNMRSHLWIKFDLQNSTSEPLTLEIGKPHMSSVFLFEPKGNTYKIHKGGSHIPIEEKDYQHNRLWFRILPFNGTRTFYLKILNPNKTAPVVIASEKSMFETKSRDDMFFGISFGILFMVLFYTLFVYITGRDTVYLYYMGYTIFVNLSSGILVGYTPGFLTNSYFNIGNSTHVIMALSAISLTLFSIVFLEVKKYAPGFMWGIYFFLGLEFITVALALAGEEYWGSVLIQLFTAGSAFLLLPLSLLIYKRGLTTIRFYILAWIIGWTFIISYLLAINGVISANFFTLNGVLFGAIFESILFSVALADKIKSIKEQTENANKDVLQRLKQNERLIIKQKEELSEQIIQRTSELATKNSELEKYSKGLEALVLERAREIIKMNDELQQQNRRLEQYTFVAGHNIRGPVARILGLLYLLKIEDKKEETQVLEIVSRLEKSAHELDSIVKDLSFLLTLDRDIEKGKEVIVLNDLVNSVLNALEVDIDKEKVLENNFLVKELNSSRPLVYSIIYNLLSNCCKFRSPQRELKIQISTREDHRHFYMTIEDNGLGMEVEKFKRKLFSPYQRFHPDIEGKGIGLFLVKTQVEALGGALDIKSAVGRGTQVVVTLIKNSEESIMHSEERIVKSV